MPEVVTRRVDVSPATFFRLLGVAVLVWLWLHLWQWILTFVIAVFLAVALDPLVAWLDGRGLRRRFGGPVLVLALSSLVVGFLYVSAATLQEQAGMLGGRITETRRRISERIPDGLERSLPGLLRGSSESGSAGAQGGEGQGGGGRVPAKRQPDNSADGYVMRFSRVLSSALVSIAVAVVLSVYLLLDGRRTYQWFVAFAPVANRPRVHKTAAEARHAIIGYVRGSMATSVITLILTFIVLSVMKVPAALLLAVVAGILNFIPVVGIVLSLVPALLLALTVSATAAMVVTGFYLGYNALENYYIQPRVFGHEMQLSGLAVIAAFAVGAELGGVLGALIALPIAAMYPPIEGLWLKGPLDPVTIDDHRRIEQAEEH